MHSFSFPPPLPILLRRWRWPTHSGMGRWIRRSLAVLAAFLVIAGAVIWMFWLPLPSAPAREAAGTERITQVEGRQLAYYVSGEGAPVILLASLGREASDFNELASALNAAGYRTIAFQGHGIGRTDLPEDDFSLLDIANDLSVIVESEVADTEQLIVIGHAFGNRVARAFATQNDERVRALVLIASGGRKDIPEKASSSLRAIFNPLRPFLQRKADVDFAFFADGNAIPDYWTRGWHTQTAIWQGKAAGQPYEQWGAGGTKPMLVLQADEDEIAPPADAGIPLAREFPDRVKLVVVRGTGHAFLPERPDEVASQIVRFIGEMGSPRGPLDD